MPESAPPSPPMPSHRGGGVSMLAAVAAAGIIGAGSWFGLGALDGTGGQVATPSPSASEPTASGPDVSVPGLDRVPGDWAVDWTGTYTPDVVPYSPDYRNAPASFDDGLDHANLPPLVDRFSPRYPEAHQLTDEIWGEVGPGWYIVAFGFNSNTSWDGITDPTFHLVSPEGAHFALPALSHEYIRQAAEVTYVNLAERWAIVSSWVPETGESGFVYQWDLVTGKVLSVYQTPSDGGGNGQGDLLDVLGPFSGGAELRMWETDIDWEVAGDRSVSFWTPDQGETPLVVPDGLVGAENLYLSGPIDATGTLAMVLVWNEGDDYPGEPWLFDSTTLTFTEINPAEPDIEGWCWEFFGIDSDSGIQRCYDGTSDRYFSVPWDGSAPVELDRDTAFAEAWSSMGIAPSGTDDNGAPTQLLDVAGATPVVILDTFSGDVIPYLVTFYPIDAGGGRLFFADGYGQSLIAYDRATGTTFELETPFVPDTGWRGTITGIYVIPALPGEEDPE